MSERIKPIWEQYGITIEEYARAFNEELSKASERLTKKNEQKKVMRICNINTDNINGRKD